MREIVTEVIRGPHPDRNEAIIARHAEARDPYADPTPCGGARTEIVREVITQAPASGRETTRLAPTATSSRTQEPRPSGYDPRRMRRALALKWERLGPSEYRIWGGAREHHVKLDVDPPCDCEDFHFSDGTRRCKHLILAELCETLAVDGDGRLLRALQAMLEQDEERKAG
jgi:hypothetical protein